ncbi:MAG: energy transducer TonB [Bacteroidales bacterium]|nr:energy transducer TonB [Bacteroidales bacterium]MDD3665334.1 energy transducer TonB [Bacteroidales bacterium]
MKKLLTIFVMGLLTPATSWSQTTLSGELNKKVIEGFTYIFNQKMLRPDDILIVQTIDSKKFFVVTGCMETYLEGKETDKSDYSKSVDAITRIHKDSVYDVLWIKKRNYLTLLLPDSGIPFKKLKGRFTDSKIDSLKADIKNLLDQAYFERVKQKYDKLKTIKAKNISDGLRQITNDPAIIHVRIDYPEEARMNETQGQVEVAFVLTTSGEIADLYVLKKLGDGCTQSVLSSIKELGNKLKAKSYSNEENILFIFAINFILID